MAYGLLLVTASISRGQAANEITVPLSDPAKRGKLKAHLNYGSITVHGTLRASVPSFVPPGASPVSVGLSLHCLGIHVEIRPALIAHSHVQQEPSTVIPLTGPTTVRQDCVDSLPQILTDKGFRNLEW